MRSQSGGSGTRSVSFAMSAGVNVRLLSDKDPLGQVCTSTCTTKFVYTLKRRTQPYLAAALCFFLGCSFMCFVLFGCSLSALGCLAAALRALGCLAAALCALGCLAAALHFGHVHLAVQRCAFGCRLVLCVYFVHSLARNRFQRPTTPFVSVMWSRRVQLGY